jgi:hypothetical protein
MLFTQRWKTDSVSRNREVGIRQSPVSAESDANILASITEKADRNAAVTRADIRNYCREVCKIEITRGWVDSFISGHSAELIEKKGSPQDAPRLRVPEVFVDQTVRSKHGCTMLYRVVQPIWCSILMKSGYPTGKTDNRRRWWFREPSSSIPFIIDYLGA